MPPAGKLFYHQMRIGLVQYVLPDILSAYAGHQEKYDTEISPQKRK